MGAPASPKNPYLSQWGKFQKNPVTSVPVRISSNKDHGYWVPGLTKGKIPKLFAEGTDEIRGEQISPA